MLVAVAAPVGYALAVEEGDVADYTGRSGATGKFSVGLPMPLAVEDRGAELGGVEIGCDRRKRFEGDRRRRHTLPCLVESRPHGNVVNVVVFDARFQQTTDNFRKRNVAGMGGSGRLA